MRPVVHLVMPPENMGKARVDRKVGQKMVMESVQGRHSNLSMKELRVKSQEE